MSKQPISKHTHHSDVPYDAQDEAAVKAFWNGAIAHTGLDELRRKRSGLPNPATDEPKKRIALNVDAEVLAWYRSQGPSWQEKMNEALRAYRDAAR
jgi:uncharacterized protein (DUF4415 family)